MNTILSVKMCRRDAGELCCICVRFIKPGQRYARTETKVAHYKCAKKRNWQRQSRAVVKQVTEFAPVTRGVKIVKHSP